MVETRRKRRPLLARKLHRRMHALVAPMLRFLAEQAGIGRPAKGRTPAPAYAPVADVIVDRDQMPVGGRMLRGRADLGRQLGRHALVGIDLDDPLAPTRGDAGIAAWPFTLPGALDNCVGEVARDVMR